MKRRCWKFVRDEEGYVAVLALISMPFLMGLALLVMDVGRGNNLHTDLQQAVDAIALAGARELDGGPDSIVRAEAAMTDLLQNQARFSNGGQIIINAEQVDWAFLHSIPAHDDTVIDPLSNYETSDPALASYVLVRSLDRPMQSWFLLVVGLQDDIDFRAEAVATYDVAACDVTPLFICNPFEGSSDSFEERFADGELYSRAFTMNMLQGNNSAGPGNFGFLETSTTGANALRDALATSRPGICYSRRELTTEPGQQTGPVQQGLNVRFDIYEGNMNSRSNDVRYRPAANIRKASSNSNQCNQYNVADPNQAMALPSGDVIQNFPGGTLHTGEWFDELEDYWKINHPAHVNGTGVNIPAIPSASHPSDAQSWPPSRYNIYHYEIEQTYAEVNAQNLLAVPSLPNPEGHKSPNGNRGAPQCYGGPVSNSTEDRRMIFGAIVNCNSASVQGRTDIQAGDIIGFTSMFLTKPVDGGARITVEIVDITGNSGRGTLDTFIREEAVLVR